MSCWLYLGYYFFNFWFVIWKLKWLLLTTDGFTDVLHGMCVLGTASAQDWPAPLDMLPERHLLGLGETGC